MKIWERYILKEISKVFFLFIFAFYFLYILIDYSAHTKNFHQSGVYASDIGLYYLAQFANKADILIPFALLLATVKVLTTLASRNELIALVVSGTSLRRIMRPFLMAACACMLLLYCDFQFIQLNAWQRITDFEEAFFGDKLEKPILQSLVMKDESTLVYHHYDSEKHLFSDIIWIVSSDKVLKMKLLDPFSSPPLGYDVYDFERKPSGQIELVKFTKEHPFPTMQFDKKTLFAAVNPPKWQSLTQLVKNLTFTVSAKKLNLRQAQIATSFYYKLTLPIACILAVIAAAPFCLRFERRLPIFLIFSFSLFGMIAYFTLVNASVILGESQLVAPIWAVLVPPIACCLIFGWRYAKL